MQYRLSCYIKSLFLLLLLLQNDNFINIGLQTPCQVLEIQSLFMTTSEKRVTGGCSLSAGQRKSVWKPLGWTHDVYFFYILLHVYVTHAGCSEQFLLLLLLLWDKGFGALQSLPRLCSWTGKILTGIQSCHLNPGGASKRPRELRRWWNVFQQLDSQTESTTVEERFWMDGAFLDAWMFFSFCTTLYVPTQLIRTLTQLLGCMTSDPLCLLGLLNVEGCELQIPGFSRYGKCSHKLPFSSVYIRGFTDHFVQPFTFFISVFANKTMNAIRWYFICMFCEYNLPP